MLVYIVIIITINDVSSLYSCIDIPSKHVNATFYNQDTLRDTSKKNLLRPDLLQWSSYINEVNAQNRVADRNELFILYPELLVSDFALLFLLTIPKFGISITIIIWNVL